MYIVLQSISSVSYMQYIKLDTISGNGKSLNFNTVHFHAMTALLEYITTTFRAHFPSVHPSLRNEF